MHVGVLAAGLSVDMHREAPCLGEEQLVITQIHDGILPAVSQLLSRLGILLHENFISITHDCPMRGSTSGKFYACLLTHMACGSYSTYEMLFGGTRMQAGGVANNLLSKSKCTVGARLTCSWNAVAKLPSRSERKSTSVSSTSHMSTVLLPWSALLSAIRPLLLSGTAT